ncbi:hypothetical protein [Campylobacter subantarcticus]|uniref:Uncharacterized protein n=1 Tax=Campylobacter subantarcticus LMG 24374 TaxID=1388751 RepID=A0A0A8HAV2_9BACT|nr:hypothetical protein [Campylobacter subantarcticus]AJC90800.1 hypothetical protein CSUB8521_0963 [Campylobacter subantarcticus LMG 24374]EAJ1261744.1 hypothetical protein [Campylobacter lari]
MFDISKLFGFEKIAIFALIALSSFLFFKNHTLTLENENLKLKSLHLSSEINVFKDKLKEQNNAIEKLKIELKPKEVLKEVLKVDKVFIKDESCQSELNAYKELFNILGSKQ